MYYTINYEVISPVVLEKLVEQACEGAYAQYYDISEDTFELHVCFWDNYNPTNHDLCKIKHILVPYV